VPGFFPEVYPHSPYAPSWRGQGKKLYLTFT